MTDEKEICAICNKDFINLSTHLRTKHGLTMEEYENEDNSEPKALESTAVVEETFGKIVEPEETLNEFLSLHVLTKQELVNIVMQYKTGRPIPITQMQKVQTANANTEAAKLSQDKNVSTRNLHIAEALVKQYGFKVKEVTTRGGTIPKTWILEKIK